MSRNKTILRKIAKQHKLPSIDEVMERTNYYDLQILGDINASMNNALDRCTDSLIIELGKRFPNKSKNEIKIAGTRILELAQHKMTEKYPAGEVLIGKTSSDPYKNSFTNWLLMMRLVPEFQSLGDTIGYKNGEWEFNKGNNNVGPEYANEMIYEFISLGGINDLSIDNWFASDDTIMYLGTFNVLIDLYPTINDFGTRLREVYLKLLPQMENQRGLGETIKRSLDIQKNILWNQLPYNSMDIGAGSCMRSGCIGLFYPGRTNRDYLISLAIECSRITHNSAIAILGSVATALFTAYAVEKTSINKWPHKFLKILRSGKIDNYIKQTRPNEFASFSTDKILFQGQWEKYISFRFSGLVPKLDMKFMKNPVTRIKTLSENYSKGHIDFPGSCGDDAVIMAYDALLECGGTIEKLIIYSMLHHGDSDTIGSIAMSWFGIVFFDKKNLKITSENRHKLEFHKEISNLSKLANFTQCPYIYNYDLLLHFAYQFLKNAESYF
uniref:ADP-ribosylglycohydrolase n=1 Tax=viral metagenome TaxID=1070528 RepID=A0A6C0LQZ7_9ZZZZ